LTHPSTVGAALELGRRALEPLSETPNLDTQLLLSEALDCTRAWVLAHPEAKLNRAQAQTFVSMVSRCQYGEALAYVIGWWEFYGRRFQLTPDVLIPRPETELLIEGAMQFLIQYPQRRRVADVGTGCGGVAVTLAAEAPDIWVTATDLSFRALQVAQSNAREHCVASRVQFLQADLLVPVVGSFDLICANLPYIPTENLQGLAVATREPCTALDGGADGMVIIRRLLACLPDLLEMNGRALFEIGTGQGDTALTASQDVLPTSNVEVRKDLAGRDRLLVIDRMD
jgi:release factor glutamine methyltransferase